MIPISGGGMLLGRMEVMYSADWDARIYESDGIGVVVFVVLESKA
jgi:hypothetical protein